MSAARLLCIVLASALLPIGIACNDRSDPVPLAPSNPPPPPAPTLTGLTLSGQVALFAVGETTQLTATASFSDGTTKNVNSEARWSSIDPSVATVSAEGLVTVVSLGRTVVVAQYQNRSSTASVTATPPGTHVISGRVREPGQSGLPDAIVTDLAAGRTAITNRDGLFYLAGSLLSQTRLAVAKPDYEPRTVEATATTAVDAPVQRIIRVTAGDSAAPPPLAPNDVGYEIDGVRCEACRLIRIVVPTTGDMEIRLTWQATTSLSLFVEGSIIQSTTSAGQGSVNAFVTIPTPRELVVYFGSRLGSLNQHLPFRLTTTRPGS
jgi:hypothetical protein